MNRLDDIERIPFLAGSNDMTYLYTDFAFTSLDSVAIADQVREKGLVTLYRPQDASILWTLHEIVVSRPYMNRYKKTLFLDFEHNGITIDEKGNKEYVFSLTDKPSEHAISRLSADDRLLCYLNSKEIALVDFDTGKLLWLIDNKVLADRILHINSSGIILNSKSDMGDVGFIALSGNLEAVVSFPSGVYKYSSRFFRFSNLLIVLSEGKSDCTLTVFELVD